MIRYIARLLSLPTRKLTPQTLAQPRRLHVEALEDRSLPSAMLPWFPVGAIGSSVDVEVAVGRGPSVAFPAQSSSSKTMTPAIAAPSAPALTAAVASTSQVDLNWTASSTATEYLVQQLSGTSWKTLATVTSDTAYAVTGLSAGTTYSFRIAADNGGGQAASGTCKETTAPAAPQVTTKAASMTQINLSWSGVKGATSYTVQELIDNSWQSIATLSSSTTSFKVTGLTADTSYSFEVIAGNASGASTSATATLSTQALKISSDPTAAIGYAPMPSNDTLFGPNGPSYLDVEQGYVGDCWLIASLAEVAARDPQDIVNMFTYDGTTVENGATVGVYTVRFYNAQDNPVYVTITSELPDAGGYYDHPINGVLWVALAEKAYAVANGMGDVTSSNNDQDSYNALNSGNPTWALHAITGDSPNDNYISSGQLANAWSAGKFIVLCTGNSTASPYIVSDHAYAVVGYNSSNGMFQVLNPWGGSTSTDLCIQDNQVYGLFSASASFISSNYYMDSIGASSTPGTHSTMMNGSQTSNSSTSETPPSNSHDHIPTTPWQVIELHRHHGA